MIHQGRELLLIKGNVSGFESSFYIYALIKIYATLTEYIKTNVCAVVLESVVVIWCFAVSEK